MEKKSKKNAIIDAFSGTTQRRDNTYTSPTVMAPYKPVNTTSEFIEEQPKEERPVLVNGRLVMPKKKIPTRIRNKDANPGLINVSPEFELLSMGGGFASTKVGKKIANKAVDAADNVVAQLPPPTRTANPWRTRINRYPTRPTRSASISDYSDNFDNLTETQLRDLYTANRNNYSSDRLDRLRLAIDNASNRSQLLPPQPAEIFNVASGYSAPANYSNEYINSIGKNLDLSSILGKSSKRNPLTVAREKISSAIDVVSGKADELNTKIGHAIDKDRGLDRAKLEVDINKELKNGVGIKKADIGLSVKAHGDDIDVYVDALNNGKPIRTGRISIPSIGIEKRPFTKIVKDALSAPVFPDYISKSKGVVKTMDFPLGLAQQKRGFELVEKQGIGGEIGEAIKRGIKTQNKKWDLMSSRSHTDEGAIRYLNEYLNGRKKIIEGADRKWMKKVDAVKSRYPNGISKEDTRKLLKTNPELLPVGVRFLYGTSAAVTFGGAAASKTD